MARIGKRRPLSRPRERSLVRDVALLVVGAIIAFLVQQYGGELLRSLQSVPPSLSSQLTNLRRLATKEGLYPVIHRVNLRGDGTESIVVESIFAYRLPGDDASAPRSDRIAIYDLHHEDGGVRLSERFSFSPMGTGGRIDTPSWRIEGLNIEDLADDGRHEIVGSFSEDRADDSDSRPFLISWDPVSRRYVIEALLRRPIPFSDNGEMAERVREYRTLYGSGATLTDRETKVSIQAYGTGSFAVQPSVVVPGSEFSPARLVTVESTGRQSEVEQKRFPLEINVYTIDARSIPVILSYCGSDRVMTNAYPSSRRAISHLLEEAPSEALENPTCS